MALEESKGVAVGAKLKVPYVIF
jgi:hypothetical protein